MGINFSGEMYTLSPFLNDVATTPEEVLIVNFWGNKEQTSGVNNCCRRRCSAHDYCATHEKSGVAEYLFDATDLGLVLEIHGGVEVRHLIRKCAIAHHLPLARVRVLSHLCTANHNGETPANTTRPHATVHPSVCVRPPPPTSHTSPAQRTNNVVGWSGIVATEATATAAASTATPTAASATPTSTATSTRCEGHC